MDDKTRQKLVEQRATNAQTVVFVADRLAEMADTVDELAQKNPEWSAVAAMERARRDTLMEVAEEEKRLATEINLGTEPERAAAADERELRKDLLEIARSERRTADELWERQRHSDDDPTPGVLAEQAERNADLLRHVAATATEADRNLRESDDDARKRK